MTYNAQLEPHARRDWADGDRTSWRTIWDEAAGRTNQAGYVGAIGENLAAGQRSRSDRWVAEFARASGNALERQVRRVRGRRKRAGGTPSRYGYWCLCRRAEN